MPIPIDQFEKGLGQIEFKIIEFLESNPDEAYSAGEVAIGIGKLPPNALGLDRLLAHLEITEPLNRLAAKNLIRAKNVGNEVYYAAIPGSKTATTR